MGLPLVCGMFVMVLYNLVDTYFIGKLNDDYQLAAVSLAYPLMMVMIAISNMVGTGCSSLIARSLGAKDYETANRTVSVGFALTFVMSLLVTAAGLIFLNPLVELLGADKTTFEFTRQYSQVILIGSFATMGSFTFGQLLRSEGSATFSIVGMIAGTVTNIVLDPVFIFRTSYGYSRSRDSDGYRQYCRRALSCDLLCEEKKYSQTVVKACFAYREDLRRDILGQGAGYA